MKYRTITIIIMAVALVLLVGWDIFAYVKAGREATISDILLDWSQRWPVIPLAFGVLMGHLFWPLKEKDNAKTR